MNIYIIAIAILLSHIAMGYVTFFVNEEKGYNHGYLWGLLLGVFGVIAVMARPYEISYFIERMKESDDQSSDSIQPDALSSDNATAIKMTQELLKYKEMYQSNQISKEEYESYLNKTITNLKS